MANTTNTDIGPLDWRVGIVDKAGRPTPEFQRRWNLQRANNGDIGFTVGHGPPVGTPAKDGLTYIDIDTDPTTEYISNGGVWLQVAAMTFLQLLDTPNAYTGQAGKTAKVNSGENALEFVTISGLLDQLGNTQGDILYRNATGWVTLAPGTAGFVLTTGGAAANPAWAATAASMTAYFGSGAPSTLHNEGDVYFDTSTTPYTPYVQHTSAWHTFGSSGLPNKSMFFAEGLLAANELLGEWSFPTAVIINQTNVNSFFTLEDATTADCDLPLEADTGAGYSSIGHIHFPAGLKVGSLVITSNPYTLTAHSRMRCLAPASPDTTAAGFYAFIAGT